MKRNSIRSRAPKSSTAIVRRVMVANVGNSLKPERVLRSALRRAGLRFHQNRRPIPRLRCEADVVFVTAKVCVFVDGCFWHGCPEHFTCPKTNSSWWQEKIRSTRLRDRRQRIDLAMSGWTVLRFWEHDVIAKTQRVTSRIVVAVGGGRVGVQTSPG